MREMKDSGIERYGLIPSGWKVLRLKYVLDNYDNQRQPIDAGKRCQDGEILYDYYGASGIIDKIDGYTHSGRRILIGEDGANLLLRNLPLIYIANGKYWVNNHAHVLAPKYDWSVDYFAYQLESIDYFEYITGSAQPKLSQSNLNKVQLIVPSNEEQIQIADYLNAKCKKLNSVALDIQEQMDILEKYKNSFISEAVTKGLNRQVEMRESGIRWCPNIPVHWKTDRGKFILQLLERPVYEDDGVITCFRDGEVTLRSKRREDGFTVSLQEAGYQGIEPGDLVVHGMDGFAGAIGISDSRGKGTPVLNVMDSQQNKRYLMYYLRWIAKIGVFESLSTGIRVRSCDTNWNKLRELPYIVPPIEEQDAIAKYLDEKCAKIDEAIADKRKLLDILDNYKKSLIFEYVTGKKEVPVNA